MNNKKTDNQNSEAVSGVREESFEDYCNNGDHRAVILGDRNNRGCDDTWDYLSQKLTLKDQEIFSLKTQLKELTEKVAFLSQEKEALEKEESFEEWCNTIHWLTDKIMRHHAKAAWNHQAKKIDNLRETVLDFQERYSGALKTIKELEKANDILYSKVLECSNSYYRKAEENKNLIAALKKAMEIIESTEARYDDHNDSYGLILSSEYQAIKHLLDEK